MSMHTQWHSTYRWQQHRLRQLKREPLCAMCLAQGKVTAATVADHITPHKGDYELFWHGPLQSLCAFHHNKTKQRIERKGSKAIDIEYSNACDVNGKPIDPNHPSLNFK